MSNLYDAETLLAYYSDSYKDDRGCRPRNITPEQASSVKWLRHQLWLLTGSEHYLD